MRESAFEAAATVGRGECDANNSGGGQRRCGVRRTCATQLIVVDLFKVLAEQGKLQGMVAGAREKAASAKAK